VAGGAGGSAARVADCSGGSNPSPERRTGERSSAADTGGEVPGAGSASFSERREIAACVDEPNDEEERLEEEAKPAGDDPAEEEVLAMASAPLGVRRGASEVGETGCPSARHPCDAAAGGSEPVAAAKTAAPKAPSAGDPGSAAAGVEGGNGAAEGSRAGAATLCTGTASPPDRPSTGRNV
jgi:hypothetical protein